MLSARVIPALLLKNDALVKTVNFKNPGYIGDPINTCRIFNELEVDELCFLDITASKEKREPNYSILKEISSECFMPLSYGGGITNVDMAEKIFKIGFEKVVINSAALDNPELISQLSKSFGSQSVIVSIDLKRSFFGKQIVVSHSGSKKRKDVTPVDWLKKVEELGAGEILLTSVDQEGTWSGFDLAIVESLANSVEIPVIAHGGAGSIDDIEAAIKIGASAVALGSMVVYQAKGFGVLVNFPDRQKLEKATQFKL